MTQLLLVRHGETSYNNERRFLGHSDVELSASGEKQVRSLEQYLNRHTIDAIYSSDLKRTMKTAEIIRGNRKLEIVPCHELREMDYGVCEGMTIDEIEGNFPEVAADCRLFNPELNFPEGETFREFTERVTHFAGRLKNHRQSDKIMVVSHNGPLRVLVLHFLGIDIEHWWQFRLDIASLSIIDIRPRGGVLVNLNHVPYKRDIVE